MEANNNNNNQGQQSSSSENTKKRNYRRRNNKKPVQKSESTQDKEKQQGTSNKPRQKKVKEPLKGFIKKPVEEEDEDEDAEVCFICTRPIDYYATAPCDHRTCHLCTLRLRVLYNTKNCAYCKAEGDQVIFTNDGEKPFESFTPEDTPFTDKKYGIRFETEAMFKDTKVVLQHNCPQQDCEAAYTDRNELKRHVKSEHQRQLCDLCVRNKKIFSHEHTLYTQEQLKKHHNEGDASFNKDDETGFTGHPECVFCRTRFYGADEIYEHCRDKHEQCHLCLKKGIQHQYYANYDELEKHFRKEHYLCVYKECLEDKFVVFDSDIDLKAHEVNEHGNGLSRRKQTEARRVDVNLNYGQRNTTRHQPQRNNQNNRSVNLSAEDFPDINGSTAPLLSSRLASVQLTEQDHWPTLGEDNIARSSSASDSEQGVSRHAAALDQVANIFKNFDKVLKFRQLTSGLTSLSVDTETYVSSIYDLCDKDADLTAKVLNGAKDLVDNRALKNQMVRAWNQKKNPNSSTDTPRVLVVDPSTSDTARRVTNKKKTGVWDKVASAAVEAGAIRPMQSKTPWSGSTVASSTDSSEHLFPALPSSAGPSTRRSDIDAMIKKKKTSVWGESNVNTTDSDYSDNNNDTTNRKKKGKKGKQVLFRVGL